MRIVHVKGVLLLGNDGSYVMHSASDQNPAEMFAAIAAGPNPIWPFDPSIETAHFVEVTIQVPETETLNVEPDAS
jgi:hypothetical protein